MSRFYWKHRSSSAAPRRRFGTARITLAVFLLMVVLVGIISPQIALAQTDPNNPDVLVAPAALDRLSWGAVIAGTVIAIVIQLALNLLGVSIGTMSLTPEYGEDATTPKELATGAAAWVTLSTLISLFIGGWVAGRFAGIPNNTDGFLHGLMVWGLVTLAMLLFISSSIGRIMSGMSTLLSQGLHLAGQVTQGVVQGVTNVAQRAVPAVSNAVQQTAANVSNTVQNTVDSNPELANAMRQQQVTVDKVLAEARQMLEQAGISPEQMRTEAEGAVQEVKAAAGEVAQNPAQAGDVINRALDRVFQRGQNVIQEADREAMIRLMAQRGNMTEQQARETFQRWEDSLNQARQDVERTRQQISQQAQRLQSEVEDRVDDAKHEVERVTREAAQATTQAIAKLAAAVFAAIVIGAIAAGVGGLVGAPETVPTAEVDTSAIIGDGQ